VEAEIKIPSQKLLLSADLWPYTCNLVFVGNHSRGASKT
jgi:hypothetical protein